MRSSSPFIAKAVTATTGIERNSGSSLIHQDQIGTKLANEIKCLETVAGTRGLIAMRFQQIAEELHIELVVLHDQDGFCHPVPPIPRLMADMRCIRRRRRACRKVNSN